MLVGQSSAWLCAHRNQDTTLSVADGGVWNAEAGRRRNGRGLEFVNGIEDEK
jgi:hypothetical protein